MIAIAISNGISNEIAIVITIVITISITIVIAAAITLEEFEARLNEYKTSLAEKFQKGHELEFEIQKQLEALRFGKV